MSFIRPPAPRAFALPAAPIATLATRVFWAWSQSDEIDPAPYDHAEMLNEIFYHRHTLRGIAAVYERKAATMPAGDERRLLEIEARIWRLRVDAWEALTARGGCLREFRAARREEREFEAERKHLAAGGSV